MKDHMFKAAWAIYRGSTSRGTQKKNREKDRKMQRREGKEGEAGERRGRAGKRRRGGGDGEDGAGEGGAGEGVWRRVRGRRVEKKIKLGRLASMTKEKIV